MALPDTTPFSLRSSKTVEKLESNCSVLFKSASVDIVFSVTVNPAAAPIPIADANLANTPAPFNI